ncbi:MAG: hypothetical protein OXN79_07885 [bacterium]|nr:hypothetical protein [bacterium]
MGQGSGARGVPGVAEVDADVVDAVGVGVGIDGHSPKPWIGLEELLESAYPAPMTAWLRTHKWLDKLGN